MNIAMLHAALAYKYAYINILWVFPYFNCHANVPPLSICSLYFWGYQSTAVNAVLPSVAASLAQNTCHTSCKCQTHVEGANTRTNNMKNWWKPKMKTRAREAKHAKLKREICRVVGKICVAPSKTRKSEQQEDGKDGEDGEVCVTSDSFYTQMTWQHLLRQSGKFSTLPKYLPEARSRCSRSQRKSLIRTVCTLVSSSPNCHLMVH